MDYSEIRRGPNAMGGGLQTEETLMQCVICKKGEVQLFPIEAELKIGKDRLLVLVRAEGCAECGEAYYSTETMQYLEHMRESFEQRTISPPSIGSVYQVS